MMEKDKRSGSSVDEGRSKTLYGIVESLDLEINTKESPIYQNDLG